jgi:predicted RecB family nuclease
VEARSAVCQIAVLHRDTFLTMQRFPDSGELVLSATDLTNFLACGRLTQERLKVALGLRGRLPKDDSPHGDLVRDHGERYEAEQLARLSAEAGGHETVRLPSYGYTRAELGLAAEQTAALMRAGAPLVYQAVFADERWQGRVDFLRRVARPSSLGEHAYDVVDTKLARSVKPQVVHQLSLYTRLAGRIQGDVADRAFVLLGDGTEEPVELRRYAALHRRVVARLEAVVADRPVDLYPEPVAHCGLCRLERECLARRRADDHLSFVAGVRRTHRDVLAASGTTTLAALATLPVDAEIAGLAPERLDILRGQAGLQHESRVTEEPTRRHLPAGRERGYARLPKRSAGDVFFDFEGDPYVGAQGIEYLWGWTTADGTYHHIWAHDEAQEAAALRAFVAWVDDRRERHPDLHVFHYGAHEASKLKSLTQQHGLGETAIDAWLRAGVLVDLYAVVRQAMQVGEESYSLKRLERHYGFERREHTVRDGGGSIVAYEAWLETRDDDVLEAIRRYNAEDCESTAELYRWLLDDMRPAASIALDADFDELAKPDAEDKGEPGFMAELGPVRERLLLGIPLGEDVEVDADQAERRLLAHLLLYHYRESKPQYWHWFAMRDMTPDALVDEREAIGMIALDTTVEPVPDKRSLRWTYRFPAQESKLEAGRVHEPLLNKSLEIVELGEERLVIRRRIEDPAHDVRALIPQSPPDGGAVRRPRPSSPRP